MSQGVSPEVLAEFFERPTSNTLSLRHNRSLLAGTRLPAIDTSVDASAAIQEAIDALAATIGEGEGGGTVALAPGTYTVGTIQMRNHVRLLGAGEGTVLKAKANIGGPVLQEAADGDRFLWVESLRIDGNKAAQSTGSDRHGIWFNQPTASPQEYADAYNRILNVTIVNCKDDGLKLEGRGETRISNVNVRDCDGHGFLLDALDCDLNLCGAGNSGLEGFYVTEANNRLSNCKAFYSGRITAATGSGFRVDDTGNCHLINCEAQDNNQHGFWADDSDRVSMIGCLAEGNNAGHAGAADQSAAGFFIDNSSYCTIIGEAYSHSVNTREQKYGLDVNGADTLTAVLKSSGNSSGHYRSASGATNLDLRINAYGGQQDLGYAASRTPDPTRGNYVRFGSLTGDITVNVPSAGNVWTGCELHLRFKQDATGGRTVTFGAGFRSNWSPSTTASKTNCISFVYNSTDDEWIQVASAVNL
jgi:parallel beta-helix repeat protein